MLFRSTQDAVNALNKQTYVSGAAYHQLQLVGESGTNDVAIAKGIVDFTGDFAAVNVGDGTQQVEATVSGKTTMSEDSRVAANSKLTVKVGAHLVIPEGKFLYVDGELVVDGIVTGKVILTGTATVNGTLIGYVKGVGSKATMTISNSVGTTVNVFGVFADLVSLNEQNVDSLKIGRAHA